MVHVCIQVLFSNSLFPHRRGPLPQCKWRKSLTSQPGPLVYLLSNDKDLRYVLRETSASTQQGTHFSLLLYVLFTLCYTYKTRHSTKQVTFLSATFPTFFSLYATLRETRQPTLPKQVNFIPLCFIPYTFLSPILFLPSLAITSHTGHLQAIQTRFTVGR